MTKVLKPSEIIRKRAREIRLKNAWSTDNPYIAELESLVDAIIEYLATTSAK